jgi:hypothetical protein
MPALVLAFMVLAIFNYLYDVGELSTFCWW